MDARGVIEAPIHVVGINRRDGVAGRCMLRGRGGDSLLRVEGLRFGTGSRPAGYLIVKLGDGILRGLRRGHAGRLILGRGLCGCQSSILS